MTRFLGALLLFGLAALAYCDYATAPAEEQRDGEVFQLSDEEHLAVFDYPTLLPTSYTFVDQQDNAYVEILMDEEGFVRGRERGGITFRVPEREREVFLPLMRLLAECERGFSCGNLGLETECKCDD